MPPLNLYARVRIFLCNLHTRPRVQRAPGFPCALCLKGERSTQASGASRREIAKVHPVSSPGLTGRPSIPETSVTEPRSRSVLDHPPSQVMTVLYSRTTPVIARSPCDDLSAVAPQRSYAHNCHRPRRRTIQYSRDVSDRTEKPQRTGSPAFAGDDSFACGRLWIQPRPPIKLSPFRPTRYQLLATHRGGPS